VMMKEFGKTIISITLIFWLFLGSPNKLFSIPENKHDEPPIVLECRLEPIITHQIGRYIHSVFGEYYGNVIYDGIWVGRDSPISNIDGLRKDVIEGCKEAGIAAFRWPGGCCADHYYRMHSP